MGLIEAAIGATVARPAHSPITDSKDRRRVSSFLMPGGFGDRMELPLMLAGPILRRVEPTLVSVWVALSAGHDPYLAVGRPRHRRQREPDDRIRPAGHAQLARRGEAAS